MDSSIAKYFYDTYFSIDEYATRSLEVGTPFFDSFLQLFRNYHANYYPTIT